MAKEVFVVTERRSKEPGSDWAIGLLAIVIALAVVLIIATYVVPAIFSAIMWVISLAVFLFTWVGFCLLCTGNSRPTVPAGVSRTMPRLRAYAEFRTQEGSSMTEDEGLADLAKKYLFTMAYWFACAMVVLYYSLREAYQHNVSVNIFAFALFFMACVMCVRSFLALGGLKVHADKPFPRQGILGKVLGPTAACMAAAYPVLLLLINFKIL